MFSASEVKSVVQCHLAGAFQILEDGKSGIRSDFKLAEADLASNEDKCNEFELDETSV